MLKNVQDTYCFEEFLHLSVLNQYENSQHRLVKGLRKRPENCLGHHQVGSEIPFKIKVNEP